MGTQLENPNEGDFRPISLLRPSLSLLSSVVFVKFDLHELGLNVAEDLFKVFAG